MSDSRDIPGTGACPACRYDMVGSPTPICPECGIHVLAECDRRKSVRHNRDQLWMEAYFLVFPGISILAALTAPLRPHSSTGSFAAFVSAAVWWSTMTWSWVYRRGLFVHVHRWRVITLVLAGSFAAVTSAMAEERGVDVAMLSRVLAATALVVILAWRCSPGRSNSSLLVILGAIVFFVSGCFSILAWAMGWGSHVWSCFTDPRLGQIHNQYPLRWDEARCIFTVVLVVSGTVTAMGLRVRRLEKLVTSAKQPDGH